MSVDKTWKWKHLDKRTYDKYVDKGAVSRSQFESHLKALPDEAANATWVEVEMDETELGADLDDELLDEGDENGLDETDSPSEAT